MLTLTYPKPGEISEYELRDLIFDCIHRNKLKLDDIGWNESIDWNDDAEVDKIERHIDSMSIDEIIAIVNKIGEVSIIQSN